MKYLLIYLQEDNTEECLEVEANSLQEACSVLINPITALPDFEAIAVHNPITKKDLDWVSCLLDTDVEKFSKDIDLIKLSIQECS